jgi:hypothetical protein
MICCWDDYGIGCLRGEGGHQQKRKRPAGEGEALSVKKFIAVLGGSNILEELINLAP